jgi:hypothetical protein
MWFLLMLLYFLIGFNIYRYGYLKAKKRGHKIPSTVGTFYLGLWTIFFCLIVYYLWKFGYYNPY